jgi:hypothetical protein
LLTTEAIEIHSGGCWDVHSNATLTHDAGGDSLAIANMARYTITTYKADASRVFAVGNYVFLHLTLNLLVNDD